MPGRAGAEGARSVTLADVARLAGVSVPTASKALNGRTDVAERTRQRVLDAADNLSFVPNSLAQGLLGGRTGTVGLLTSDLEGRFVIPILMGAEDAFGAGRVNIFLCDARGDTIREQHQLRALLSRRVDGLIVVGASSNTRPSLGHDLPVPVVYVYAPSDDPDDTSLVPDNRAGGRMAVEHLVECGRTRIAHISGDPSFEAVHERVQGVLDGLAAAGLQLIDTPRHSEWSEQWGRDATALLLKRHPDIDAVLCGSDQIARGALDTLRDLGRTVPDDVAVIGYDNWLPLAGNSRPELSSIDPNLEQLGRRAAQRLFAVLDGEESASQVELVEPRLIIRGSTVARR